MPRLDATPMIKSEPIEEEAEPDVKPKRKYKKRKTPSPDIKEEFPVMNGSMDLSSSGYTKHPAEERSKMWAKHSDYLKQYVAVESDPREWTEKEVIEFVTALPYCSCDAAEYFIKHRIDGESLLMLSQEDLVNILKVKVGPAVKLYNCIVLLREKIAQDYT